MEPLQREPLGAQEVQAACESVTADGINALSNFVDSRVQWVMPDKWIWIPGVYEFESTEVPKKNTTVVCKYTMILFDDKSVKYTWYNTESSKKTIEHMLTIEGILVGLPWQAETHTRACRHLGSSCCKGQRGRRAHRHDADTSRASIVHPDHYRQHQQG